MPEWFGQAVEYVQLILNATAVVGGAVIWGLYVRNLRAISESKSATIETLEKNRDFWKDKTEDLEKRTPEVLEKSLTERIQIRDGEIARLKADKESNSAAIRDLEVEKAVLEQDLFRTKGFRAMLALEEQEYGDEVLHVDDDETKVVVEPPNIQVQLIGYVAVDSGQLMVTDPCYVDSEWQREPYKSVSDTTPTQPAIFNYSYGGVCRSTLSGDGYGELVFRKGHTGAGVAFATAWGDGMYPVYAEKHDGHIVRVYINVA